MTVAIRTAGILKQHIAPGTTVENVTTVGDAVEQLGLTDWGELIMLVNNKPAYWYTELRDGDTLSLLPGISGGRGSTEYPRKFRFARGHLPPP